MPTALEGRLEDLKNHLDILPEAKAPPPSMLEVLGRSHQEQDWQRLLFHFLSPNESHGLGHELLERFLTALSERDDLEYTYSRFDLEDVQVEQEVSTDRGRPDAVLWSNEEWFICWELKIGSAEGRGQTQAYVDLESFDGIGLSINDVPGDSHFYLYLAPDGAEPPEAEEFVQISWEWVVSVLQSFLAESHGEYPARTTAQLNDFIGTIRSELTMTEYEENFQEKTSLYVDYYDEIAAVQDAFEDQWEDFTNNWGTRLAETLETAEIVDGPDIPDRYAAVELEGADGERNRWIFRQGISDWGGIMKDGWWRQTDTLSNIWVKPDNDEMAGLSFYHRLSKNRDMAIEDGILEIEFWHSSANPEQFRTAFNRTLADREEEFRDALPAAAELPSITESRGKLFTVRYKIRHSSSDHFLQAYTEALEEAFLDLGVTHDEAIKIIDQVYEESIDMYR